MARSARSVSVGPLAGLVTALVATLLLVPLPPASAAGIEDVVSRRVHFEVVNNNDTGLLCPADNAPYRLHGRLVGPRDQVLGANAPRVNVLVHDLAAGAWFWNLRRHPAYDYAGRLADRGETSLVLDRLGYGSNPLADGTATCLGAQAQVLHQVVQHLRSGLYEFSKGSAATPAAHHVVTHGHGVGAAVAQLEAAEFDDVAGLVLMSWSDRRASDRATEQATRQAATCLQGPEYAAFADGRRAYRRLVFETAPRRVQRSAVSLRSPDPCGDVLSLAGTTLGAPLRNRQVEAPVLLLFGGKDARNRDGAARQQAGTYTSSERVVTEVVRGAGNALPLEKSAPRTRRTVARWLCTTLGC